jgi:hypothetical protein
MGDAVSNEKTNSCTSNTSALNRFASCSIASSSNPLFSKKLNRCAFHVTTRKVSFCLVIVCLAAGCKPKKEPIKFQLNNKIPIGINASFRLAINQKTRKPICTSSRNGNRSANKLMIQEMPGGNEGSRYSDSIQTPATILQKMMMCFVNLRRNPAIDD